ncbi:MAG: hypothetical protein NC300_08220 [Bacteroidales bacterium]|nr:hypothetical protein [Clostridium sp.]MCM1204116.1 hypothetical protein [Bacteroidales bacterium]
MRITTQMLAQTSRETGIPLAQGSLLDVLNKKNTKESLFDTYNKTQDAKKASAIRKEYQKLGSAAEDLGKSASRLTDTEEDALFTKAGENGETKDILSEVKDMLEAYNKTLELLKGADGSLNQYYYRELKNAATVNAEQLKTVGITRGKDGSMAVEEKVLENADYDTLKKVFGSDSDFVKKADYIGGRIAENAQAGVASISSQYNAKGMSYQDSTEANKYNFFG